MSTIGFSTGSLSVTGLTFNERLRLYLELGCNAVELGYVKPERLRTNPLGDIDLNLLKRFSWVSMHAPAAEIAYDRDQRSFDILEEIQKEHQRINFNLVIFHPHTFTDISILQSYDFPIGIENMDNRKSAYLKPQDFEKLFQRFPDWKLVLDVNHCYTNDQTFALLHEFTHRLSSQIGELHLSGYRNLHEPLHITKQKIFFDQLNYAKYPVIVESMLDSTMQASQEYQYIINNINTNVNKES